MVGYNNLIAGLTEVNISTDCCSLYMVGIGIMGMCLVSALVIQPVLLRSVLRRFVHVTRSDNHLL